MLMGYPMLKNKKMLHVSRWVTIFRLDSKSRKRLDAGLPPFVAQPVAQCLVSFKSYNEFLSRQSTKAWKAPNNPVAWNAISSSFDEYISIFDPIIVHDAYTSTKRKRNRTIGADQRQLKEMKDKKKKRKNKNK